MMSSSLYWWLMGVSMGLGVSLGWAFRLPPCEECGRGLWRWKSYMLINDRSWQVMVRPFRWRWHDVLATTSKLSGYRKIYSRWVLRGPFEVRVWSERRPKK